MSTDTNYTNTKDPLEVIEFIRLCFAFRHFPIFNFNLDYSPVLFLHLEKVHCLKKNCKFHYT